MTANLAPDAMSFTAACAENFTAAVLAALPEKITGYAIPRSYEYTGHGHILDLEFGNMTIVIGRRAEEYLVVVGYHDGRTPFAAIPYRTASSLERLGTVVDDAVNALGRKYSELLAEERERKSG